MNRSGRAAGVMQQSSPVQQMQMMMPAAGNPTCWWNTANANAPMNYQRQQPQFSSVPPPSANNNCNFHLFPPQISSNSPWQFNDSNNSHQAPQQAQEEQLFSANSWSQLLMSGLISGSVDDEKERGVSSVLTMDHFPHHNEAISSNWEDNHHQMMQYHHEVKQEINHSNIYPPMHAAAEVAGENHNNNNNSGFHVTKTDNSWSSILLPAEQHQQQEQNCQHITASSTATVGACCSPTAATSSPQSSCVTFSTIATAAAAHNLRDFSHAAPAPPTSAAACESLEYKKSSAAVGAATTSIGGAVKKAKIQSSSSSSPSTFKVRKFGDRITSLHQLVSPFGKTDTASVLLEAIGYIRFLQSQIEALSLPYLSSGNGSVCSNKRQLHPIRGDHQQNCLFPEDPGQLLNDNKCCLKRKAAGHDEQRQEELPNKDLSSRGLCLVPVSCTLQVGSESSAADYWAPAAFGGFGL